MHAMLLLQPGDHPWPKHDPPLPRATDGPLVAIRGIFQISVACRKLIGKTCYLYIVILCHHNHIYIICINLCSKNRSVFSVEEL